MYYLITYDENKKVLDCKIYDGSPKPKNSVIINAIDKIHAIDYYYATYY